MATITTNLGLTKPAVGADADQWGDQLNASLDVLDAKVLNRATGGSVTGPISATGAISGASLAATGSVTGATATLTGAVNAASASITNGVSAGSVTATGAISAGSLSTTGTLSAGAASVTTLSATGNGSFPSVTTPIVNAVTALALQTGGTTKATLDSAGNLGLGVTPSAFDPAVLTALQVRSASFSAVVSGANDAYFSSNATFNGGSFKYINTGTASQYRHGLGVGSHVWNTAPSGTAGAPITFTQAMTLTQGGNLLVGTTVDSAARQRVANAQAIDTFTQYTNQNAQLGLYVGVFDNGEAGVYQKNGTAIRFGTTDTERARITSAGYFKASNTGVYVGASNSFHEFYQTAASEAIVSTKTNDAAVAASVLSNFVGATFVNSLHFQGVNNDSTVYRVLANGNVQNTNNSFGAISDAKLKEDVTDAAGFLDRLQQVRIVNYTLKADESKARLLGVIAQELEQVFPGLIEETPDMRQVEKTRVVEVPAVDAVIGEDGEVITPAVPAATREETYTENEPTGEVTKAVKYSVFVPMLIKALQEETEARKALETRIAALEAK